MPAKTALKPADCRPPIIHVAATLLFFNVTIAQAQTIDCSFATAVDEVAICRSADLRTMDGELDRAYRAARVRWTSSMSNSVRIMQEEWIKERRKCGADEECLMNRMIERITALEKMRPDSPRWMLASGKSPTRTPDWQSIKRASRVTHRIVRAMHHHLTDDRMREAGCNSAFHTGHGPVQFRMPQRVVTTQM